MAAMSPRNAARAAQTTQSPATRPASALMQPGTMFDGAAITCSTGMQPGGTVAASATCRSATGHAGCPGSGQGLRCAAHRGHVAGHEGAVRGVGRVAEGLGDDLRTDARGVAQRDGDGKARGALPLMPGCRCR
jgi:hypothetical protein